MISSSRLGFLLCLLATPLWADDVLRFDGATRGMAVAATQIEAAIVAHDGQATVAIRLQPPTDEEFAAFSTEHIGQEVIMRICGQEVSRAVLQAAIGGGRVITPPMPVAAAETALAQLTGEMPCQP